MIKTRKILSKKNENRKTFDELDEKKKKKNDELKDLREAESHIRAYLASCGDIEICFDKGCQNIRNFQGVEINPLSL